MSSGAPGHRGPRALRLALHRSPRRRRRPGLPGPRPGRGGAGPARPRPRPLRAGRQRHPRRARGARPGRGLRVGRPAVRARAAGRRPRSRSWPSAAPRTRTSRSRPHGSSRRRAPARRRCTSTPRSAWARSVDHRLTYEAAVRAFATEAGRNLFLYEERPEAFVPGAVRTRLALLGARLPPGAARARRARGPRCATSGGSTSPTACAARTRGPRGEAAARSPAARRRFVLARPWNPLRAFGPRLQPIVHVADEEARESARRRSPPPSCRRTQGPPAGRAALRRPRGARRRRRSAASTTPSGSGSSSPRATACPRSSTRSRWPRGQVLMDRGDRPAPLGAVGELLPRPRAAAQRSGSCSHSVLR